MPGACREFETYRCPYCKRYVVLASVEGGLAFLHAEGVECHPRRAWVFAGMYAAYWQWREKPEEIRIVGRCVGTGGRPCNARMEKSLPACNSAEGT